MTITIKIEAPGHDILERIYKGQTDMTAALAKLTQEVAETKTVAKSAVTLLRGLKAKLDEALAGGNVEADIQALADSLDTDTNELAAAVTENTPAEVPSV